MTATGGLDDSDRRLSVVVDRVVPRRSGHGRHRQGWSPVRLYVDPRTTGALLGTVIKYVALAMLVPLAVAVVYGEDIWVFVVSIALAVGVGLALERLDADPDLGPPEALLLVALSWVSVSLIGAVPYLLAGFGTESSVGLSTGSATALGGSVTNALFESTSGFTTTGATVLDAISPERHSHALLMWRQLTQWLGGMGIIVLMVAILPELAVNGTQLIRTEAPGPSFEKLTPRIAETARILWLVYFGFTVLLALLFLGMHYLGPAVGVELAPNMNPYNAVAHAFTTLPTGGFSPESASAAAFDPAVQLVFVPFLLVAGTNFALFWYLLSGDVKSIAYDPEFRAYIGAIAVLVAVLALVLVRGAADSAAVDIGHVAEGAAGDALRQALFQIGSIMNSTGYATSDFAQWDTTGQIVILFAMFIGGSAGSTGGGIKVIRWLVILKAARRELSVTARPNAVRPVRLGNAVIDEAVIRKIAVFTVLYFILYGLATAFFLLDYPATPGLTVLEAMSASIATLGNIGPGFGALGPFGNYLHFPTETKLVMVFLMWVGRLEIVPILAIFTGVFWRSS
jgi:trk system potassium uptake protein TrkH